MSRTIPTLTAGERETVLGGALAGLLKGQERSIAEGMQGLCMASSSLRDVRAAATEALRLLPPGGRADTFLVDLVKACDHLAAAVADIPNELWAILLNTTAGAAEVRARLAELRKAA